MTRTDAKQKYPHDLFIWGDAPALRALAPLIDASGLRVVGVGTPPREELSELPEGWKEAERCDDPRIGVQSTAGSYALFADASVLDDPGLGKLCAQQQVMALALGPTPLGDAAWSKHGVEGARVLPLLADGVLFSSALEALEPVGAITGIDCRFSAPTAFGGVASRLFDTMHLIHRLLGVPDRIDASGHFRRSGGTSMRALTGDLRAHLRFPGASATVSVSDRVDAFARDALLLGESGLMRFTDEGFVVLDASGDTIDRSRGSGEHPLVEQLSRASSPNLPGPDPYPREEVLAMCEATALSVRTGQPERPREVLEMMHGGA